MESQGFSYDFAGRNLTFSTGEFALQATGSVVVGLGDTRILATAVMSETARDGADFFPMSVDYEERFYAAGKIKGSRFVKREGKPSDTAILNSRLIDRPIRPLFPKGMTNEVQIMCTVLSADLETDPAPTAITAASAALMISGMPFKGPVAGVHIGLIKNTEGNDELVVNPTYKQIEEGMLDLTVAGTKDAITMVEAGAHEVSEELMLEALELAHKHIKRICILQEEFAAKFKKKDLEYIVVKPADEVIEAVKSFANDKMLDEINGKNKAEVKEKKHVLEEKILEHFKKDIEEEKFPEGDLKAALMGLIEKRMRYNIVHKGIRLDGRKIDEIRPIQCKINLLPRTHGSALFQRGETQALSITTLGAPGAAMIVDTMEEEITKRYMHFYQFPPYAVGEVKPNRGPSRRDIGHGALAERALVPVLPKKEDFPYTMLVVSEILSCNGSSSMASVCGSSLSLMAAGVPIKKPVSAIAMGLVTDGEGNYKILSDIQGMEDFAGDMDFKVAGTDTGITALQMDIKISGLSIDLMKEALGRAKEARAQIMAKMNEAIAEPKKELSPYAPLITSITIDPDKIREVIGKGGETIQKITAECGVEIDIEDSGLVTITAPKQENGECALKRINQITYVPQVGDVFEGKVTRIMDFGCFVEFVPGKEGLVHISQLAHERVNMVEDVVEIGDTVKVKLVEVDDMGRYNFSMKALLPRPEGMSEGSDEGESFSGRRPSGGGRSGGGRGGFGGGGRRPFRR
ncbi:polyribonucleotide nucleotidyltransferase [Candidatus Peregrinibacteria bacterium]|nr:polyribonucleotide nucleotidyltransferase [Candidatus Peregrinibacteria bacterium]